MYIEKETSVLDVQLYGVTAGAEIRVYDEDIDKSVYVTIDFRIDEQFFSVSTKNAMITCLSGEEDVGGELAKDDEYLERYKNFCDTQTSKYAEYFFIAKIRIDELMQSYFDR